jgi:hypothetical protein
MAKIPKIEIHLYLQSCHCQMHLYQHHSIIDSLVGHREFSILENDKYCFTEHAIRLNYKNQSVNAVREIIPLFIASFKQNT